jgi:Acyl-CoA reductase (LuxC)
MILQQRIELATQLGEYLIDNSPEWQAVKEKAALLNPWFMPDFIELSVKNICSKFLKKDKLEKWTDKYQLLKSNSSAKKVGLVMAGNIPLVGFHDFLCVWMSGHHAIIKASSKDDVLIKHIVEKLIEWNKDAANFISFADTLKNCDAYIATGSNNSSRYFEYYFGKYPNIIRRNRTSVAVLNGNETEEELNLLADDIQLYFGLGCRNVTKLYVPENYDFMKLLDVLKRYDYFMDFHKYKHNFDYQLALLIMGNKFYMNNGSIILTENQSIFSPVSQVNYEYYKKQEDVIASLKTNDDVQCTVGKDFIPFGQAQSPSLNDYADGVDTMQFLSSL